MLHRNVAFSVTALVLSLFAGTAAAAMPQRTFVASNGSDLNSCSIVAPCRSFTAALAQTASGGEIIVLDSAAYGPVTINQAVSIIAPAGIYAGVSVFSGDGIVVDAPGAIVALRGLTITGLGGAIGIRVNNVGQLRVEGVHVSGFTSAYGLLFAAGGGSLTVTHSAFEGNWIGMEAAPPVGTTATIVVEDTLLTQNLAGYMSAGPGTTKAVMTRTNASANGENGFVNYNGADTLNLENCVASHNFWGIYSVGTTVLSNNTVTNNVDVGVYVSSGTTESRQNNTVRHNGTNVSGSLTTISGI